MDELLNGFSEHVWEFFINFLLMKIHLIHNSIKIVVKILINLQYRIMN